MSKPLYVRRDNRIQGPFPAGQIAQCLLIGRFRLSDEVSEDRETWQPIRSRSDLIPDVLKGDPQDPALQERLQAARRWADERRPAHAPQAGDRRLPEDPQILEYRQNRESIYRQISRRRERTFRQALIVLVLAAGVVWLGFRFAPQERPAEASCQAPPAPGVNWHNCLLSGLQALDADLTRARLDSAVLVGANLFAGRFDGAKLDYADLSVANLSFASFRGASLKGATLRQADLRQADLRNANLAYANLTGARLGGAHLEGAILDNAIWTDGRTCLPGSVGTCRVASARIAVPDRRPGRP